MLPVRFELVGDAVRYLQLGEIPGPELPQEGGEGLIERGGRFGEADEDAALPHLAGDGLERIVLLLETRHLVHERRTAAVLFSTNAELQETRTHRMGPLT